MLGPTPPPTGDWSEDPLIPSDSRTGHILSMENNVEVLPNISSEDFDLIQENYASQSAESESRSVNLLSNLLYHKLLGGAVQTLFLPSDL